VRDRRLIQEPGRKEEKFARTRLKASESQAFPGNRACLGGAIEARGAKRETKVTPIKPSLLRSWKRVNRRRPDLKGNT